MTTKLQVTVPKALAEQFGIRPGSEIRWESSHDAIRVVPARSVAARLDAQTRLDLFDQATKRQRARQTGKPARLARTRGWSREELYDRGRPR